MFYHYVYGMEPNKVLLSKPSIHTTLAQLRSGYSNHLNSYKARIYPLIQIPALTATITHTQLVTCLTVPIRGLINLQENLEPTCGSS